VIFLLAAASLAAMALSAQTGERGISRQPAPDPARISQLAQVAQDYAVSLGVKLNRGDEQSAVMTFGQYMTQVLGSVALCNPDADSRLPTPDAPVLVYAFVGYAEMNFYDDGAAQYRGDVTFTMAVALDSGGFVASNAVKARQRIDLIAAAEADSACVYQDSFATPSGDWVVPESTISPEMTPEVTPEITPEATAQR
jgi:hypothetical protein